ncbi:hypothetical protein OUZ56_005454 [Daphnia magna]|uniref:Uncharacterized protein n=1 Tax=Daphnia magna TaxID=35525 RepID=A0ABQ9YSY1_9CRUS|nr:hypothetical protein OUZ56_005454 [Daphnia magna]
MMRSFYRFINWKRLAENSEPVAKLNVHSSRGPLTGNRKPHPVWTRSRVMDDYDETGIGQAVSSSHFRRKTV